MAGALRQVKIFAHGPHRDRWMSEDTEAGNASLSQPLFEALEANVPAADATGLADDGEKQACLEESQRGRRTFGMSRRREQFKKAAQTPVRLPTVADERKQAPALRRKLPEAPID